MKNIDQSITVARKRQRQEEDNVRLFCSGKVQVRVRGDTFKTYCTFVQGFRELFEDRFPCSKDGLYFLRFTDFAEASKLRDAMLREYYRQESFRAAKKRVEEHKRKLGAKFRGVATPQTFRGHDQGQQVIF